MDPAEEAVGPFESVTPGESTVPPTRRFREQRRMTFSEWKRWVSDRRAWRRRVALTATAVLIAEASCAIAWTSFAAALDSPTRRP